MSTGYDIRYAILKDAREHLMEDWHRAVTNEQNRIEKVVGGTPRDIPLPTADDIKKLAEELYEFVQKKG